MSLEDSINKLTAALEAATGALIAASAKAGAAPAAPAAAPATAPKRGPGRPAKTETTSSADAGDGGLGGDDLGSDDGGLGGGDDLGGEPTVTPEEAKAAVLAYRDKAIKAKGKDAGLAETRALMNKFVKSLDEIKDDNAAAVQKAFNDAIGKLK